MIMYATILRVDARGLLVRDAATGQEVYVNTSIARQFRVGETVRITYNGRMTLSIPPQITAQSIVRVSQPGIQPQPSQTEIRRAVILQVRNGSLLVRDMSNQRQVVVNFALARHFCTGQQVNIQFDSVILGNLMEINATEVTPLC